MQKREVLILALISIIILVCIISLIIKKDNVKIMPQDEQLKVKIDELIVFSNEIWFKHITDFEWDEMYIIGPYANPQKNIKSQKINWKEIKTSIETNDSITLIVFLYEGEIVSYLEYPRSKGNFNITGVRKYNKETGYFRITNDEWGVIDILPQ